MDLILEIVIEFIVTLFVDNTDDIIKNKKISKWIRYPVIFITILLCSLVTVVPIILGFILLNKNIIASIILILIGIIFITAIIYKIKKTIEEKNNK